MPDKARRCSYDPLLILIMSESAVWQFGSLSKPGPSKVLRIAISFIWKESEWNRRKKEAAIEGSLQKGSVFIVFVSSRNSIPRAMWKSFIIFTSLLHKELLDGVGMGRQAQAEDWLVPRSSGTSKPQALTVSIPPEWLRDWLWSVQREGARAEGDWGGTGSVVLHSCAAWMVPVSELLRKLFIFIHTHYFYPPFKHKENRKNKNLKLSTYFLTSSVTLKYVSPIHHRSRSLIYVKIRVVDLSRFTHSFPSREKHFFSTLCSAAHECSITFHLMKAGHSGSRGGSNRDYFFHGTNAAH